MHNAPTLVVYPTADLAAGKAFYQQLLGVEPYVDTPYYVGFRIGEMEIGLDPSGAQRGNTTAIAYWSTPELEKSVKLLLDSGAQVHQEIGDVGGGMRIAIVRDPGGNLIGLREPSVQSN